MEIFLRKLKLEAPHDSAIPLLGICLKRLTSEFSVRHVYSALQLGWGMNSDVHELIMTENKVWCIYTRQNTTHCKWVLREISQSLRDKADAFSPWLGVTNIQSTKMCMSKIDISRFDSCLEWLSTVLNSGFSTCWILCFVQGEAYDCKTYGRYVMASKMSLSERGWGRVEWEYHCVFSTVCVNTWSLFSLATFEGPFKRWLYDSPRST